MPRRSAVRLTTRGLWLLALGGLLVVAAFVVREAVLAWPGLFLILLPLASLLSVEAARPRFTVSRTVRPEQVAVGDDLGVELAVTTDRAGTAVLVRGQDRLPGALGPTHHFGIAVPRRGRRTTTSYVRQPRRRGRFTLDDLWFSLSDLLGLVTRATHYPLPTALMVTPPVIPLATSPHRAFGRTGETPIPHTAVSGPDDVLVREYRHSDDVRRIHWPSTARTGELMVRREEQAWDPAAWLILDSRASAHGGGGHSASFEWLVTAAASIGAHLLDEGYDLDLTDAAGESWSSRSRQHVQTRQAWLEHLVDARLTRERGLAGATRVVARHASGHLVIALVGRLDAADAAHLVSTHDASQQCRAIVLAAEPGAEELLTAHGWLVARTSVGGDLAGAWAGFGSARGVGAA